MDFVKKAQDNPVLVTIGAILAALGLLAAAWAFFDIDRSLYSALVEAMTIAVNTGALVASLIGLGLLLSFGALVAVVIGSVRNRREAQQLATDKADLTTELNIRIEQVSSLKGTVTGLQNTLVETKRAIAVDSMRRHSMMKFGDGTDKPSVTIRCADYSGDYDLANKIQNAIQEHTGWAVEIDSSNKPSLPRAEQFKVMFASSWAQAFDRLAYDFAQSELLGVSVGARCDDRADHHHLIISIFPSS